MVSKSFCVITCLTCGQQRQTRRDVDMDRGWEHGERIFECSHFTVDADIYTHNTGRIMSKNDEVRFKLYGTCKCMDSQNYAVIVGDSSRQRFETGYDEGSMRCEHCDSSFDWSVNHQSHVMFQPQTYRQLADMVKGGR